MIRRGGFKDSELVKMIKQGSQEMNKAIEFILSKRGKIIKDYLMKQNCRKEEAEDVLFEGLSIFVMNVRAEKFQKDSSINTYLIAICKRIWYKRFNKKVLHEKWEKNELRKAKTPFEEVMISKELAQGLEVLMNNLKDKCREVLKLWSLSYSMEEIKNQLGYSTAQVATNKKNLCLKQLRKQLSDNPKLMDLII